MAFIIYRCSEWIPSVFRISLAFAGAAIATFNPIFENTTHSHFRAALFNVMAFPLINDSSVAIESSLVPEQNASERERRHAWLIKCCGVYAEFSRPAIRINKNI